MSFFKGELMKGINLDLKVVTEMPVGAHNEKAEIANRLYAIQELVAEYKFSAVNTLHDKDIRGYGRIISNGSDICNLMLEFFLWRNTEFDVNDRHVSVNSREYPLLQFCTNVQPNIFSKETLDLLNHIKEYVVMNLNHEIINEKSVLEFCSFFDDFIKWFGGYIKKEEILNLEDKWNSLENFLVNEQVSQMVNQHDFDKFATTAIGLLNDNKEKLEEISNQIIELQNQIVSYQSSVGPILKRTDSDDEIDIMIQERLTQFFVDECAERIVESTRESMESINFEIMRKKLIILLGESAWNKLDESSRNFLITSKMMFDNLVLIDSADFSGICILVTKALEVEMKSRFYYKFLEFEEKKYGRNYSSYHTALVYRKTNPLKPEKFTMGNLPFAMGSKENYHDSREQKSNNEKHLLEYVKSELVVDEILNEKTDSEIMSMLKEYGKAIEKIRTDYRNPSAHTNRLHRTDAEECFDLVLDVEKLLKRMMDSFKK